MLIALIHLKKCHCRKNTKLCKGFFDCSGQIKPPVSRPPLDRLALILMDQILAPSTTLRLAKFIPKIPKADRIGKFRRPSAIVPRKNG